MNRGILQAGAGLLFAMLLSTGPALGADLLAVYDQALVNDPLIREAQATRKAQHEARPQAMASLLPQIAGSASRGRSWNSQQGDTLVNGVPIDGGSRDSSSRSDNTSWGLNLRQSVFSWANWVNLRMSDSIVAQAEANYMAELQALAQRVAEQYFAVLNARDNVRAQEAARDAISRQLEQSERRFEVGLIAITDVEEAKAERDSALAQVIAAKRALARAEEELRATIGERPLVLNEPPENMPLLSPNPASAEDWVRMAMEQNAQLVSSRLAADIARDQVDVSFSGHLPSVDLTMGRNYNRSTGRTTVESPIPPDLTSANSSTSNGKSITLSVSVPLFSGGATQSRVRESQYRWIAAKERLERTSRVTERNTRDAFLGVNSEIARVEALRQALASSRTAVTATEAGYEVGTRTAVDVLGARRQLILAETNYSSAKYSYLNQLIQLRLAAGDLDRSTLAEINRLLTVTPAPAPAP